MQKTITATQLRDQVGRVLDEVRYTQTDYIVNKLGQPFAVVISLEDYELLQAARRQAAAEKEGPPSQTPS
jgi:prevent-host-death family protein